MRSKTAFVGIILSIAICRISGNVLKEKPTYEGKCGSNVMWKLADGELRIDGDGEMSMRCNISAEQVASVTSVVIGGDVTTIAANAFMEWGSITSVSISNKVKEIGEKAFSDCSGLTSVRIPRSVISIGKMAFSSCVNLRTLIISEGVKNIDSECFVGASGLKTVTIPSTVESIGTNTFGNCGNLSAIDVASNNSHYSSRDGVLFNKNMSLLLQFPGGKEGGYVIPSSVSDIARYAFYLCTEIQNITIPKNVKSIGMYAFYGCSKLKTVNIPSKVKEIEGSTFFSCYGLESINLSYGLATIGNYAFSNCSFSSLKIPDSVQTIGMEAFSNCTELESVILSASLNSLGNSSFRSCQSLVSISLPASVKSIADSSFDSCYALESVDYFGVNDPCASGVKAFGNCNTLSSKRVHGKYSNSSFCGLTNLTHFYRISLNSSVWYVSAGGTVPDDVVFGNATQLMEILKNHRAVFDDGIEFNEATIVNTDIELVLLCNVIVNGVKEASWDVVCGNPLCERIVHGNETLLQELLMTSRLIDEKTSTTYSESTIVEVNVQLSRYHDVICSGEFTGTWIAPHGEPLVDIDSRLAEVITSNEFLVINKANNAVIDRTTTLLRNMELFVKKPCVVVIVFDPVIEDFSSNDILDSVSSVTGVDPQLIVLEVVRDEDNYITSVKIYINDLETANAVADKVSRCIS